MRLREVVQLSLVGSLSLVASTALFGQTEVRTGSNIRQAKPADFPDRSGRLEQAVAWEITQQFGHCVIQESRRQAEAIAGTTMSPTDVNAALRKMASDECLRGGILKIPLPLMRGAIFTALYRRDFRSAQPVFLTQPFDYKPISGAMGSPESNSFLAKMGVSSCLVRTEPLGSRALILARPGSQEEDAAFAQISPKLAACIQTGQTVKFSRSSLTSLIAEALYRESRAALTAATPDVSR